MKKNILINSVLLLLVLILASCTSTESANLRGLNKQGDSLLFSIDDNLENPIYIQGSIHLGEAGLYPLDSFMMEKFNQSQVVYFEVKELRDNNELLNAVATEIQIRMFSSPLKNGQTIKSLLSEQEWENLMKILAVAGLDEQSYLASLDGLEPWVTSSIPVDLMQSEIFKGLGLSQEFGVDPFLAKAAVSQNKEIRGIEGISKQVDIFSNYSVKEQLAFLKDIINTYNDSMEKDKGREIILNLYNAFKNKSAEGVLSSALEEQELMSPLENKDLKSYYRKQTKLTLDDRNKEWVKVIENDILKDPSKKYFIVVGSLHLVGKGSVIELLLKRGHKITQY